jgi:hypothetical protein
MSQTDSTHEGREGPGDRHSGPGDASGLGGEMVRVHWVPPGLIRDLARPTIAELSGGTDLTPYVRDVQPNGDAMAEWAEGRGIHLDEWQRAILRHGGPIRITMRVARQPRLGDLIAALAELDARMRAARRRRLRAIHAAYRAKTRRRNRRLR